MKPASFQGISEIVVSNHGQTRRAQVLVCSVPGCQCKLELPVNNDRKPPDVVFNIARRKGWHVEDKRRVFRCPGHMKKRFAS